MTNPQAMTELEQRARAITVEHIDGTGLIDWDATLVNIVAFARQERQAVREAVQREWVTMRRSVIEISLRAEMLAGNQVKIDHEKHAMAEIQGLEDWLHDQARKERGA